MKKSKIAFVLVAFIPALAGAQQGTTAASANGQAAAKAELPSSYSVESQAKLNATFARARAHKLPEQPIRDRVAEGQAKAASETQVVIAAQHTEARLETAQSAMVRGGRQPNDAELIRAEAAIARGATEAQIETAARNVQSDQELTVQLDALAAGPTANAKLGASAALAAPGAGAAAGVTGAAAATAGAATTITGAATAGVGAVIKKPPMI